MQLIKTDSREALDMIKTNTKNPAIQKAVDAVYELNADEVLRQQIWDREKAINDYNNDITVARLEGEAKGREEGRKEGREEGRKEVKEEGREEGRIEGQLSILKRLVENGTLTISQASAQIDMTMEEFLLKTGLKV